MASPLYQKTKSLSRGNSWGKVEVEDIFLKGVETITLVKNKKDQLNLLLNKAKEAIDPVVIKLLSSGVDEKNREIVNYQILAGGKRIRPALAIIACRMLGGKTEDVLYPAAGIELLHNYSLIIDDIIDNSSVRRSKAAVWKKYGRSIAECAGVDFAASIFESAQYSRYPTEISRVFIKAMKAGSNGEILDLLFEAADRRKEPYIVENRYSKITEQDYLEMVGKKTAALFQACCEVGAICAKAKQKQLDALKRYGLNLGIAFQIKDDILDIFGEQNSHSNYRKIGKDIKERKQGNIVILLALQELQNKQEKLLSILSKKKILKEDINKGVRIIEETTAKDNALRLGQDYVQKAKDSLRFLPQNKWNGYLSDIAGFGISRKK